MLGSPEKVARKMMRALVARGCRAGDMVQQAQLQTIAAMVGINGSEREGAIQFALDKKWIVAGNSVDSMSVTTDGWENGNA